MRLAERSHRVQFGKLLIEFACLVDVLRVDSVGWDVRVHCGAFLLYFGVAVGGAGHTDCGVSSSHGGGPCIQRRSRSGVVAARLGRARRVRRGKVWHLLGEGGL